MKTVAYLRVSTDEQSVNGVSLAAQHAKVEQYCQLYDLALVDVVEDAGVSAKTLDRPGLQRVLAMLRRGEVEAVVVAKLDRLTRSVRDLGALIEGPFAKAALLSVGEQIDTRSAGGRLVLHVLGSVAQWERETVAERTKVAMQHLRTLGRRVGGIPYGWRVAADGRHLEEDQGEQIVLRQARELRVAGHTLQFIADELSRRGHMARNGEPFVTMQISRMVRA